MTSDVTARINAGALPRSIEGGDARNYAGRLTLPTTWQGWCRAWFCIAWVRLQGFERDGEAEADAWNEAE